MVQQPSHRSRGRIQCGEAPAEELGLEEDMHVRIVDADLGLDTLAIVDGAPLVGGSSGAAVTLRIPGV